MELDSAFLKILFQISLHIIITSTLLGIFYKVLEAVGICPLCANFLYRFKFLGSKKELLKAKAYEGILDNCMI